MTYEEKQTILAYLKVLHALCWVYSDSAQYDDWGIRRGAEIRGLIDDLEDDQEELAPSGGPRVRLK